MHSHTGLLQGFFPTKRIAPSHEISSSSEPVNEKAPSRRLTLVFNHVSHPNTRDASRQQPGSGAKVRGACNRMIALLAPLPCRLHPRIVVSSLTAYTPWRSITPPSQVLGNACCASLCFGRYTLEVMHRTSSVSCSNAHLHGLSIKSQMQVRLPAAPGRSSRQDVRQQLAPSGTRKATPWTLRPHRSQDSQQGTHIRAQ